MLADASSDLTDWSRLVNALTPLEQFALIGLLQKDPSLSPQNIDASNIVGEEKCFLASSWYARNFRAALRAYCEIRGAVGNVVTKEGLALFMPTLTAAVGFVSVGVAAAFFGFMLSHQSERWCERFGTRHYEGDGIYNAEGDEFKAHFWLEEQPAIDETRRERGYTDRRHAIQIFVPPEISGRLNANSEREAAQIARCCGGDESVNFFDFYDVHGRKQVYGDVVSGELDADPRYFRFVVSKVRLT